MMKKIINYILSSLLLLLGFSSCKSQRNLVDDCRDFGKKDHEKKEKLIPGEKFNEPVRCMYGVPEQEFRFIDKNNPPTIK